jgi:hypothetical protein
MLRKKKISQKLRNTQLFLYSKDLKKKEVLPKKLLTKSAIVLFHENHLKAHLQLFRKEIIKILMK